MTACDSQLLAAIQSLQMEDNPEPSRTPLRSRPPPFLRLLTEIHLEITSYFEAMGDPEILQLSCTCRYFRQIIAKPDHQLLLKIEKHPLARYAGVQLFLACRYCLRLRKRCYFSDRMLRKTGKADDGFVVVCALCGRLSIRIWMNAAPAKIAMPKVPVVF
ncbi:hypothetical protein N0V87_008524 [Didymella glomerata]|uniref:F-box domain-containing protein n=1 Tax=Didymella glomerata TaxID=749621 RepID=A0A9W9BWT4_9PLEO|nr:hypothetical protein N0V87_008524 [Didymella glomerata]